MADEDISLEIRALSEVYRRNDGRPGHMPVSPYKLARDFKLDETEVLNSLKMLRIEGYLTRTGDEDPVGSYADKNSFFYLTDEGKEHFEELCGDFEPEEGHKDILETLHDVGPATVTKLDAKLPDLDEETLAELLDELVVYHLVDAEGPPYGLVKYSSH